MTSGYGLGAELQGRGQTRRDMHTVYMYKNVCKFTIILFVQSVRVYIYIYIIVYLPGSLYARHSVESQELFNSLRIVAYRV